MSSHEELAGIAGIDAGATLTKLALPAAGGTRLLSLPSGEIDAVIAAVRASGARRAGVTGGGAARIDKALAEAREVVEFEAWRAGVRELLRGNPLADEPFLLVSIGTGTSVMRVDGDSVQRLGGTPLGGGTILGLGQTFAGTSDFAALCALAERGDRARVDLSVADVYADGPAPLATDVMASSFARLAEGAVGSVAATPEDCVRSLMAMVGENVALLAGSLSLVTQASHVVFGGSTLQGNETLRAALSDYLGRFGREAIYLEDGAYAGALGARRLVARDEDATRD